MPEVTIGDELAGSRFDLALARVAECSRSHARRLIDDGEATLDGEAVAARTKVHVGQVVAHPELEEVTHEPDPDVEVTVLWEDAHVAVIDKPAGLVVHAGAGRRVATLAQGLVARWPEMLDVGEPGRWGLVHRLDRDTSGALLVAKTEAALATLQGSLRRREVGREYLALIEGHPGAPTGTIDAPIGRDPTVPTRRRVDPNGRPARTHYRVKEEFDVVTLMDVRLETGRTHQIRVHFAAIGHPIVADRVYRGATTPSLGLHRTWLHAARLTFPHPVSGEEATVSSPLPGELAETLVGLRT